MIWQVLHAYPYDFRSRFQFVSQLAPALGVYCNNMNILKWFPCIRDYEFACWVGLTFLSFTYFSVLLSGLNMNPNNYHRTLFCYLLSDKPRSQVCVHACTYMHACSHRYNGTICPVSRGQLLPMDHTEHVPPTFSPIL